MSPHSHQFICPQVLANKYMSVLAVGNYSLGILCLFYFRHCYSIQSFLLHGFFLSLTYTDMMNGVRIEGRPIEVHLDRM